MSRDEVWLALLWKQNPAKLIHLDSRELLTFCTTAPLQCTGSLDGGHFKGPQQVWEKRKQFLLANNRPDHMIVENLAEPQGAHEGGGGLQLQVWLCQEGVCLVSPGQGGRRAKSFCLGDQVLGNRLIFHFATVSDRWWVIFRNSIIRSQDSDCGVQSTWLLDLVPIG